MAVGAVGSAVASASMGGDWLTGAWTAIQESKTSGGILGALGTAASKSNKPGSISSFLKNSRANSNAFATIASNSQTSTSAFVAQLAAQQIQKAADAKLQKAMKDLQDAQTMVQVKNVLDPTIFFKNGATIDTESGIMTLSNGKQIDTRTGIEYIDPLNIVSMGNGSFLNTKTNILTMVDGTRIDTVTGQKVTT